jgi:hypothetical protein
MTFKKVIIAATIDIKNMSEEEMKRLGAGLNIYFTHDGKGVAPKDTGVMAPEYPFKENSLNMDGMRVNANGEPVNTG